VAEFAISGRSTGELGRAIRYNVGRMSGDTTTIAFLIVAGLGLLALAVVLWMVTRHGRRNRRQGRLERGFERARSVAQSGSGVQGTPYTVYGESAWSDDSGKRD
jgi:hypothetical protein